MLNVGDNNSMQHQVADSPETKSPNDRNATSAVPVERRVLYTEDIIVIFGFDQLARPDMAVDRLVRRGDLPHRKIGGRLVFSHKEVDLLIETGSCKPRRGRPPSSKNKR